VVMTPTLHNFKCVRYVARRVNLGAYRGSRDSGGTGPKIALDNSVPDANHRDLSLAIVMPRYPVRIARLGSR
jgi:hypothetical protein